MDTVIILLSGGRSRALWLYRILEGAAFVEAEYAVDCPTILSMKTGYYLAIHACFEPFGAMFVDALSYLLFQARPLVCYCLDTCDKVERHWRRQIRGWHEL